MNKSIFELLLQHAAQDGVIVKNPKKSRFITKYSDEDSLLLSDATLSSILLGRRSRLVKIKHEKDSYFCLFGLPDADPLPDGLEAIVLTPALFTCAVLEAKVLPIATGSEIKDVIESDFMGVDGYLGHDVKSISSLFPDVLAYKGNDNFEYQYDLQRVMGSFIARTFSDLQIDIEYNTTASLVELFEAGSNHIPYGNLVRGMMSVTWEGLFLDLYRSIEQIYACIKVGALRSEWNSSGALRKLAELLEIHLAWRPKEEDSLSAILGCCNATTVRDACIFLSIQTEETVLVDGMQVSRSRTDEKLANSLSKYIYGIRNGLVHYRPVHEHVVRTDVEWNGIIRLMLKLVRESYDLFALNFFEDDVSLSIPDLSHQQVQFSAA